jgi:hypothetical protein
MFKGKDVHHYHIIEIEKGAKLPELTGDLKESLKALVNHPGFQYLLMRFRHQKAAITTALQEGMRLSETELRFLQAGTYWTSYLERDIHALTQSRPQATPAVDHEAQEFAKIQQNLDLVGQ